MRRARQALHLVAGARVVNRVVGQIWELGHHSRMLQHGPHPCGLRLAHRGPKNRFDVVAAEPGVRHDRPDFARELFERLPFRHGLRDGLPDAIDAIFGEDAGGRERGRLGLLGELLVLRPRDHGPADEILNGCLDRGPADGFRAKPGQTRRGGLRRGPDMLHAGLLSHPPGRVHPALQECRSHPLGEFGGGLADFGRRERQECPRRHEGVGAGESSNSPLGLPNRLRGREDHVGPVYFGTSVTSVMVAFRDFRIRSSTSAPSPPTGTKNRVS